MTLDSFHAVRPLPGADDTDYISLAAAEEAGAGRLHRMPYAMRVLAENLLRHEDGDTVTADHMRSLAARDTAASIPFFPERVLLQDASGVPVLADMITLRERAVELGFDPAHVSPRRPIDLVIDHALELDMAGVAGAQQINLDLEYARHASRYQFLKWAQSRFPDLRIIPPGIGICHQLNLERIADVVTDRSIAGRRMARCDSVVGTDSHTTMINALAVAGWGVGGIEATAAALGQPILMRIPAVVGVRLTGTPRPGIIATDIALTLAGLLRAHGVVEKIVEFHGPGLALLSVPDRATIANMAPEYGATMAFFPADDRALTYLSATGRPERSVALTRAYLTAQNLLHSSETPDYDESLELDLSRVGRTMAGPARPHQVLPPNGLPRTLAQGTAPDHRDGLRNGDIVIAAITSCTSTSNPRAMVAAGLLARNAVAHGLTAAPWTKTSLTPGSRATADLLEASGLQPALDRLGFHIAGFGCGTCMGNSGPLESDLLAQIRDRRLDVAAVLSGNRNFPGRIHPEVTHSYLMSPPLVVALAIAGRTTVDLECEPIAVDAAGHPVLLDDIWPADAEIDAIVEAHNAQSLASNSVLPLTTARWRQLPHPSSETFAWEDASGSIRRPPFTDPALARPAVDGDIIGARPLLLLGDDVTTDHISPVARISPESAAGQWLLEHGAPPDRIGTYSARRLNHDVMLRGGFDNPRLQNKLTPERQGAWTRLLPSGEVLRISEAAAVYANRGVPTIVVAGRAYGTGSARDWAAKVTRLLGVRAVIARSFERIHRTNLVALGVLPVQCPDLDPEALTGTEEFDITGLDRTLSVNGEVGVDVRQGRTIVRKHIGHTRIDTAIEVEWIRAGGLLAHLLDL